jgi:ribose transport system substrate-binding protein
MRVYSRLVLTVLFGALIAAGCGKDSSAPTSSATGGSDKKLKLAFVTNNPATFWTIAKAGCMEAAKELKNVDVDFRIPNGGIAEQQQIMDDLVAAGIDGIAVSPIDPPNQTDFLNKIAGQTLLVTSDSDAPKSKRKCYIGTDNTAAGVEAGKMIKEVLPNGGKIMLFVGYLDAQNAKDRMGGIKKELEGSKIQIVDTRTDDANETRARANAEDALVKYPDLDCLVGLYSYNGPALLNAVHGAGKSGKVKIVCFDENAETLDGVAAGDIYGTVVQQPFEFGKQAITRMDQFLHGDQGAMADGTIIVPTRNIKKDNVGEFQAKLKEILGK